MEKRKMLYLSIIGTTVVIILMLSILALKIKNNIYVVFPIIGISVNIAILFTIFMEMKDKRREILHDCVWRLGLLIIILSLLDSTAILLIRISGSLQEAMFYNFFQILFTSSLLTGILAFTLREPHYLIRKESASLLITAVFLLFSIFLSSFYITNVILGKFSGVSSSGGIYYELDLSEAGFGPIYPLVKIAFTAMVIIIIAFSSIQYFSIENTTIKRYYSIFYLALVGVMVFEVFIVSILTYILRIKSITFFGLLTPIYSFILAYYLIHIHEVYLEIKKHTEPGDFRNGELIIFKKKEEAKEFVEDILNKGKRLIVFSTAEDHEFLSDEGEIRRNITYIHMGPEGYKLGHSIFKTTQDLESLRLFSRSAGTLIMYSDILDGIIGFPCEKRGEALRYYRFLLQIIERGGVIIAPVPEKYLLDKEVQTTKNPLWLISPLMILMFEELINILLFNYMKNNKNKVLQILLYMQKYGMPKFYTERSRICLELRDDFDRERFSSLLKIFEDILEENNIMKRKRFQRILREFFQEYGNESYSTILSRGGELNFIVLKGSREKSIRMLVTLSEASGSALVISRINPRILRKKYNLSENIRIRWLTTYESEMRIYPHLEEIKKEIFSFLDDYSDSVIVLDAAEYLMRIHGFDALLNLFWILQDRVSTTEAILMIPINPGVFEKKDIETIGRYFHIIE